MEATIAQYASQLDGRIIIDSANRMRVAAMISFAALGQHTPQACMYRAFNTYGYENFANPGFDGVSHYSTKPWQVNNNIDYNQGGDIFAEGKDGKKQVPKQREVKQ